MLDLFEVLRKCIVVWVKLQYSLLLELFSISFYYRVEYPNIGESKNRKLDFGLRENSGDISIFAENSHLLGIIQRTIVKHNKNGSTK